MYNKYLCIILLFVFTACLDKKSSPDRSGGAEPTPAPTPTSTQKKTETDLFKIDNTEVVSCSFYPNHYIKTNWNEYFDLHADKATDGIVDNSLLLHLRNRNVQRDFLLFYNKVTLFQDVSFGWVEKISVIPAQNINGCKYPEAKRIQVKDDQIIFLIGEWRTNQFYQPVHVIFQDSKFSTVWQDEFTASKMQGLTLYRETLSTQEQKLFIRRRYGNFKVQVTSMTSNLKPIVDVQLWITNRMNIFIGNLVIKYGDNSVDEFMSPVEVFRVWNDAKQKPRYILEFGAEAPRFAGDTEQILTKRAAGNLDRNKTRIRIVYDDTPVNQEQHFVGEFIQEGINQKWISFYGSRPARAEISE